MNGGYFIPYSPVNTQPVDTGPPKNPNIYLRCKEYTTEDDCYLDWQDNCFWNIDLPEPGCRFYVPNDGTGAEGEPADLSDCQLIKTHFKCKEGTPPDAICAWDDTQRICEEMEECEDIVDEQTCNEAFYETANIHCMWDAGGTCVEQVPVETTPALLRRVRPSSFTTSDSADPIATVATLSLGALLFFFSAYVTYQCFMRHRKPADADDLDEHFMKM